MGDGGAHPARGRARPSPADRARAGAAGACRSSAATACYTAYVEGWGLYAESLGGEMGFYEDPYARSGSSPTRCGARSASSSTPACTRWAGRREQAIDFFVENAGKAEHDIVVEIDRYIVWPGQALAYKIGELKIKELRAPRRPRAGRALRRPRVPRRGAGRGGGAAGRAGGEDPGMGGSAGAARLTAAAEARPAAARCSCSPRSPSPSPSRSSSTTGTGTCIACGADFSPSTWGGRS